MIFDFELDESKSKTYVIIYKDYIWSFYYIFLLEEY